MGITLTKENEDTLKLQGVIKFEDEDDAEDAKSKLKSSMRSNRYLYNIDVEQDGKFIKFSGKLDIEDLEDWARSWYW